MTEYTCDSFRFFNLFPVYFGGKGTMKYTYQGYKVCYKHILIRFSNARRWGNSCCLFYTRVIMRLLSGGTQKGAPQILFLRCALL